MSLAHDSPLAGHLQVKKTTSGLDYRLMFVDIFSHCQRTIPKGPVTRVPLGEMPLIDTPFKQVAVDGSRTNAAYHKMGK